MPIPILMPALSPTMEVGKIAKWHVSVGDTIETGDVIVEIETDKATMEVEAIEDGRIGKICIDEGTPDVAVNSTIAMLLEEGEDESDIKSTAAPKAKKAESGEDNQGATEKPVDEMNSPQNNNEPIIKNTNQDQRVKASPLAKRLANQNNIDLTKLLGSGPNGRIIKSDIESALTNGAAKVTDKDESKALASLNQTQEKPSSPKEGSQLISPISDKEIFATYEKGTYELIEIDNMRHTVAERLTISKSTIPHFYLTIDCNLDELLAARARLNKNAPQEGPDAFKLSVNDFIIKAMGLALQSTPEANSTWSSKGILRHNRADVAVAVAVEGGLFTPVVRHADLKTLSEISNEMKDLAVKAKAKKLAPTDYLGGTTAISNLGMYGIKEFDAVINPPHATILAVGAGQQRPVIVDGEITVSTIMTVTLSCDHRVVDGALGADLLNAFKGFIEDPVTMLV